MKKIILFVTIVVALSACQNDCQDSPELTAAELAWLPYSNGQKVVYQNENGVTDTLIAITIFEIQACITDNNGCNHCFQTGTCTLGNTGLTIKVEHLNSYFPNNNDTPFANVAQVNQIVLRGVNYYNVYYQNGAFYLPQYGWLAYYDSSGMLWEKVN